MVGQEAAAAFDDEEPDEPSALELDDGEDESEDPEDAFEEPAPAPSLEDSGDLTSVDLDELEALRLSVL